MDNNIRTMKFVGVDDWSYDIYRCVETGILWKDETPDNDEPTLYSCGNEMDGELCYSIDPKFEVVLIDKPIRPSKADRFNYMLLDRLRSDCDYYLGYGNRYAKRLWAGNEQEQIDKMKELYNSFTDDKKPEWLTYEQILEYEKLMINNTI